MAENPADRARHAHTVTGSDGVQAGAAEASGKPVKPRKKLTPEEKCRIFLETQRGNVPMSTVLRRWCFHSSDMTRIGAQVPRRGAGKPGSGLSAWPTQRAAGDCGAHGRESQSGGSLERFGDREHSTTTKVN